MKIPNIEQYQKEKEIWESNGKPYRTPEKISELYNICYNCENFKKITEKTGQCQICTCFIKNNGLNFNKLAWATTICPDNPPRWTNEEEYERKEIKVGEETQQSQINSPPRKKGPDNGCGCG